MEVIKEQGKKGVSLVRYIALSNAFFQGQSMPPKRRRVVTFFDFHLIFRDEIDQGESREYGNNLGHL